MTIAALAGLAAVVLGPLALFDVADPSVDALGTRCWPSASWSCSPVGCPSSAPAATNPDRAASPLLPRESAERERRAGCAIGPTSLSAVAHWR